VQSLFASLVTMQSLNVEICPLFMPGVSMISMARNEIVRKFYLSGVPYLNMVDSDITWSAETLVRMVERIRDDKLKPRPQIICALPPLRRLVMQRFAEAVKAARPNPSAVARDYAVRYLGELEGKGSLHLDADGFGKVETAGLAFSLITRDLIERLQDAHPELRYKAADGTTGFALFNPIVRDGHTYSEDMTFCRYVADLKEDIWILADAPMVHEGPFPITGNFVESVD